MNTLALRSLRGQCPTRLGRGSWSTSRSMLSTSSRLSSSSSSSSSNTPPTPPQPIEDSTSALDYKYAQRKATRPPPLPAMDYIRNRTAEEAVTNILYNTPPPSSQPYKKHVLNCLVQNEPGVLSRVSGCLASRGFNIDSLVVCSTEIQDLSRMCIVLSGQEGVIEQARRQLEDLVPVWAVLDYTETPVISRELLLVKVSILGPEYLEEQLVGGPSHQPGTTFQREASLAQNFEKSGTVTGPTHLSQASNDPNSPPPLSVSEALRIKGSHFMSIKALADQFGGRIVDVSENSVIVEMIAKTTRVDAFLGLLRPFGVLESARTGTMVMPRTPIAKPDAETITSDGEIVDDTQLPPG